MSHRTAGRHEGVTFVSKSSGLAVHTLSVADLAGEFAAEWDELYAAQVRPGNPFTSRTWARTWFAHMADAADVVVLAVREGDQLIGVAPLHMQSLRLSRITVAKRLMLAGAGHSNSSIELPPLLARAGSSRTTTRMVVQTILDAGVSKGPLAGAVDFDWAEISLSREQGWFEPEWVASTGRKVAFYRPSLARACVMLPLKTTWEETRSGLKRNIKESLRRSRNRLAKENHEIRLLSEGHLDEAAVDRLMSLHGARAHNEEAGSKHPDLYSDPQRRAFMRDLLPRLGAVGESIIAELLIDGEVVASQLALVAPGCTYFHSSGFAPEAWALNPTTALQEAVMQDAVKNGQSWINFSPGPNVSKLRWSEQIYTHEDFAFGAGDRSLQLKFTAYAQRAALHQTRHAIMMASSSGRGGRDESHH